MVAWLEHVSLYVHIPISTSRYSDGFTEVAGRRDNCVVDEREASKLEEILRGVRGRALYTSETLEQFTNYTGEF